MKKVSVHAENKWKIRRKGESACGILKIESGIEWESWLVHHQIGGVW